MKQLLLIVVASALLGTGCELKFGDDIELIAIGMPRTKNSDRTVSVGKDEATKIARKKLRPSSR